jgi:hypothetical protein
MQSAALEVEDTALACLPIHTKYNKSIIWQMQSKMWIMKKNKIIMNHIVAGVLNFISGEKLISACNLLFWPS